MNKVSQRRHPWGLFAHFNDDIWQQFWFSTRFPWQLFYWKTGNLHWKKKKTGTDKLVPGTSVFTSSETDISGNFWGHIKGVKYRFALQDGTWDFSWEAVAGKGLILWWRGNQVLFLELRRDSRVTKGNSGFLLCWPREVQSSIRVVRESGGLLSSYRRAKETSSRLVSRT